MKTRTVLFFSLIFSRLIFAGGSLSLSSARGFKSDDIVSTSLSLNVSEKLMRKIFYSGSVGYSTGFNGEYDKTNGNFFYMNHGLGYAFSDDLSFALGVGIGYDDRANGDSFSERARLSATYKLWE